MWYMQPCLPVPKARAFLARVARLERFRTGTTASVTVKRPRLKLGERNG